MVRGINAIPLLLGSLYLNLLLTLLPYLPSSINEWYFSDITVGPIFSIVLLIFGIINIIIIVLLFVFTYNMRNESSAPEITRFCNLFFIALGIQVFIIFQSFIATHLIIDPVSNHDLYLTVSIIRTIIIDVIKTISFIFHFIAWNTFTQHYINVQKQKIAKASAIIRAGYVILLVCNITKHISHILLLLLFVFPGGFNFVNYAFPILFLIGESGYLLIGSIVLIIGDIKLGNVLQQNFSQNSQQDLVH